MFEQTFKMTENSLVSLISLFSCSVRSRNTLGPAFAISLDVRTISGKPKRGWPIN